MKILYLDCSMGAAGDMLMGALLELIPNPEAFLEKVNGFGLDGVCVERERVTRCGILGTHMHVKIDGVEEHELHTESADLAEHEECICDSGCHNHSSHTHNHSSHKHSSHKHNHDSSHDEREHCHRTLEHIHNVINSLDISDKVKIDACAVYDIIAKAEGKVHGRPAGEVHFHEVGTMDALVDVVSVCMLIDELGIDQIIASPVNTGFGHVHCAHGILPVPAPATANILTGIPVYAGPYRGEMCTPTGAALLKYFVNEFREMPVVVIENIGYGMGTKEFPQANCVRAILGNDGDETLKDNIVELACNIDDMTGEDLGYAAELLMKQGALDVYFVPIQMKKFRPGQMLVVLSSPDKADWLAECILKYTTTFGVRRTEHKRYILDRHFETVETPYGAVRVKHGEGYGVSKTKPEYEDVAWAAERNNVTPDVVRKSI